MDMEEQIGALGERLNAISTQVRDYAADVVARAERGQQATQEVKDTVDQLLSTQGELSARLGELEQRAAAARDRGIAQANRALSPGERFVASEEVQAFCAARTSKGRVRVGMQAVVSSITGGVGVVQPDRVAGIIPLPHRRMTVRDLLTPGRTSSNSIQFWQETGFTNNARTQSEGTVKGESTITGELVTKAVATIAHFIKASKQILDDAPMMASHIDGQLRYGLAFEEELQLLLGDGTGVNLDGLVPNATAFSPSFHLPSQTRIDTLRLALLQAELALFPASGIVLNPIDLAQIELTKDTTGEYIYSKPQDAQDARMWGRPCVSTPAMTNGDFLAGAFQLGAQLFDREDANVELSTEDSDNFQRNLVTLRGEERLGLAIYRPEAFTTGSFADAS